MAIETRIPKDINEYQEKIIFGLSIRQLLCCLIALPLGSLLFFLLNRYMSIEISSYFVMILVMPILAVGFIKINGFHFEKYAKYILKNKLGTQKKIYKTNIEIQEEKNNVFKKEKSKETEFKGFIPTKKGDKIKHKNTKRAIKKARIQYKNAVKEAKKENG